MRYKMLVLVIGYTLEEYRICNIKDYNIPLLLSPYTKLPFLQSKKPENSIKTWLSRQSPE